MSAPTVRQLALVAPDEVEGLAQGDWGRALGFRGRDLEWIVLPACETKVLAVLEDWSDPWRWAGLAQKLPAGVYELTTELSPRQREAAVLGVGLESYRFEELKSQPQREASGVVLRTPSCPRVELLVRACHRVRNLVNTPANHLTPQTFAERAQVLGQECQMDVRCTDTPKELAREFPMLWTVGRASEHGPCVVELRHRPQRPRLAVTLVGKGVCFDTGGLDLKPRSGMLTMKKDMGGAAHALALGCAVVEAGLPVEVRIVLGLAENAVSERSYRPSDVLTSRQGLAVEVGDTDAEGRLILADLLTLVCEEESDLVVDFATLTGAARVAMGPDVPAFFTNDEACAQALLEAGEAAWDPVWRLPLHGGYRSMLDSRVADIHSTGSGGLAGAITAALFLEAFVGRGRRWIHFDQMAWNVTGRAGRPVGGEAQGLRAVFGLLADDQTWCT